VSTWWTTTNRYWTKPRQEPGYLWRSFPQKGAIGETDDAVMGRSTPELDMICVTALNFAPCPLSVSIFVKVRYITKLIIFRIASAHVALLNKSILYDSLRLSKPKKRSIILTLYFASLHRGFMTERRNNIHKILERSIIGLRCLLVSREPMEVKDAVYRELSRLLDELGAVQTGIFIADDKDDEIMRCDFQTGKAAKSAKFPLECSRENLQWAFDQLSRDDIYCIDPDTDGRDDGLAKKCPLLQLSTHLYVLVRGYSGKNGLSLMVIEFARDTYSPETRQDELLVHLTQVLTNVVIHHRIIAQNEMQLRFEELISELSRAFINLSADRIDDAIDVGLKRLSRFFNIDRATLFQLSPQHPTGVLTHMYARTGLQKMPKGLKITAEDYPYVNEINRKGDIYHFESISELPEAAAVDKSSFQRWGVMSCMVIPLFAGGYFLGGLAFDALTKEIKWPTSIINRGLVIGEIFANALARKRADDELRRSYVEISELKERLQSENIYFQKEIKLAHNYDEIIGESETLKYVLLKIEQCAPTDATVLLLGETGTGKELIARAIHNKSLRNQLPLIKVDCGTLQSTMIERELFGHEKGAFTNAHQTQSGRFEIAHEGTLFLDEIGELPLDLQPKLLRVIQDGEFERLGSPVTRKVDVRIIAATNRDLIKEVSQGRFRRDLWYRINVFSITVPPLRERRGDIPLLVNWFVNKYSKKIGKKITRIPQGVLDKLSQGHWAGNIRELENTIERAVIVSTGETLTLADVFECETPEMITTYSKMTLEDVEREHIRKVLKETNSRISGPKGAAQILKINPSTLRFRMKKLGIT
jgi:transcriptional regulator with GAF, ATPase, and Fis domain